MRFIKNTKAALVALFASASIQFVPETVQAQTNEELTFRNLKEFLAHGSHVLGYKLSEKQDVEEFSDNVNAYTSSFAAKEPILPINTSSIETAQPQPIVVLDALQLGAYSELPAKAGFLSNVKIDTQSQIAKLYDRVIITRNPQADDKVLNKLEAWVHSGKRVDASGTFFSTRLNEIADRPQVNIRYSFKDIQTPLDSFLSKEGDCKTSAALRFSLLQALAEAGEINASVDDVFLINAIKVGSSTDGHVVAGYFDRGRQALLIMDGTGYELDENQKPFATTTMIYEDTQKGRDKMASKQFASLMADGSFVPIFIYTRSGSYIFDLFEDSKNSQGYPVLKERVIEPGKDKPLFGGGNPVFDETKPDYRVIFDHLKISPPHPY